MILEHYDVAGEDELLKNGADLAEVSDIFQAVMQGASALMLTGETAMGRYPVEAMEVLTETGSQAEKYLQIKLKKVQ